MADSLDSHENGEKVADRKDVRVLIIEQPVGSVSGESLRQYKPGVIYDLATSIAKYLVAEGYALAELHDDRPTPPPAA